MLLGSRTMLCLLQEQVTEGSFLLSQPRTLVSWKLPSDTEAGVLWTIPGEAERIPALLSNCQAQSSVALLFLRCLPQAFSLGAPRPSPLER